jgi:C_GCAxxG_C_C family probable redox protein
VKDTTEHEESPYRAEMARARAEYLYDNGYFCSEAVVTAVNELAGEPLEPRVMRLATGFCGAWREDHVCGAFAGAVMGIGVLLGRDGPEDDWSAALAAVEALERLFSAEFGGTRCTRVVGGFERMGAPGRHEHCVGVTGRAAALVFEIVGSSAGRQECRTPTR